MDKIEGEYAVETVQKGAIIFCVHSTAVGISVESQNSQRDDIF